MTATALTAAPAAVHRSCTRRSVHVRSQQPGQQPALRSAPGPASPAVPAVGWLWDKKSADTRKRLQQADIKPKKSLGQNFMLDDGVLSSIVEAAGVQPGDLVLEIGPGTGNLTRHLLAAGALVTAVEKDNTLSDRLTEEFAEVPQLRLVCGDILRQDLPQLLAGMHQHAAELAQQAQQAQQQGCDGANSSSSSGSGDGSAQRQQDVQQPAAAAQQQQAEQAPAQQQAGQQQQQQQPQRKVKVVANLPYYITKDCLVQMLPLGDRISDLYFMLQDEVGVRLTQPDPGAADWRAMNILTMYYCRPQYLFRIDRRKYHPAPKVHGCVVRFQLTPPDQRLDVPSEAGFVALVKKAFSQRRKVARNALRPLHEPGEVAAALVAVGLSEDARAQDLTLEQFGQLAWQLHQQGPGAGAGTAEQRQRQQQEQQDGEEQPAV